MVAEDPLRAPTTIVGEPTEMTSGTNWNERPSPIAFPSLVVTNSLTTRRGWLLAPVCDQPRQQYLDGAVSVQRSECVGSDMVAAYHMIAGVLSQKWNGSFHPIHESVRGNREVRGCFRLTSGRSGERCCMIV